MYGGMPQSWRPSQRGLTNDRLHASGRAGAERAKDEIRNIHPLKCLAEPVDVANAALVLASDGARRINGSDLVMDGGLLAQ